MFYWCSLCHTWWNLYFNFRTWLFVCKEVMVKALSWLICMCYILRGSKIQFFLKFSCVKKRWKCDKNDSNNGKPQITMAAHEVNSRPQEASAGTLEPPSPQEPKPSRRRFSYKKRRVKRGLHSNRCRKYEKRQRQWQTPNYYGRSQSQFSVLRSKFWRTRTAISSITKTTRQCYVYKTRR